jgi:DNA-binding transcriptional LysR family regulator
MTLAAGSSAVIRPIALSTSSNMLCEAALSGPGLTTLPTWVVDEELATGRLVRVRRDWATPEGGIVAVCRCNRMIAAKRWRFVEAIAARMGDC